MKLKKILKIGTLIAATTIAACTAERKRNSDMNKKIISSQISREEALSRIQYHKPAKNIPLNIHKQKD